MVERIASSPCDLKPASTQSPVLGELPTVEIQARAMHTLTVQTKYTFGDRVRFDSTLQGCSGIGTIFAITIDAEGQIDYMIEVERGEIQPGILENEISLLEAST